MKPIGPIPPYFGTGDDGQLMVGGQPAEELVSEAGGTPLFAYDNHIVGRQVALFRALIASGVSIYYSVTANPYEPLLNFIGRYVEGFRIVSSGELERLRRAGLEGIPIYFAGPGKRDSELEAGIAAGATISVESEAEAGRAILAGEKLGIQPRLALRVNAPFSIEDGQVTMGAKPSPFGVDAERAPDIVQALIEAGVDWRGLQMFTGAQTLDAADLVDAHRAMIACAGEIANGVGVPLPELNLGGGFDIPCFAGEEPLDMNTVGSALSETLCRAPELLATTSFSIELGRWLVGESGVYLMRVVDRTESRGRTFLTTDGGGHHMLSATGCLTQAGRGNYPIAVASRFGSPAEEEVTVTGCLATPHDVFGEEAMLPRAEVGDLIAVFCAGAYGATASPQNWESRPPAFEILA
jgi:diaminopimelate decarboxylase